MGLVFDAVSTSGIAIFTTYGSLLVSLVSTMLVMALIVNPVIVAIIMRGNPYPLVFAALKECGTTAFFTRSSVANIPVNLSFCRRLGIDENLYSVSIPLGATVNMCGAAVTITVMTLATAYSMHLDVTFPQMHLVRIVSAIGACGSSAVAGGSLLLISVSCSVINIPYDVAMATVSVGFIIGVIQDSVETAVNSSSDAVFTGATEFAHYKKSGRPIPDVFKLLAESRHD